MRWATEQGLSYWRNRARRTSPQFSIGGLLISSIFLRFCLSFSFWLCWKSLGRWFEQESLRVWTVPARRNNSQTHFFSTFFRWVSLFLFFPLFILCSCFEGHSLLKFAFTWNWLMQETWTHLSIWRTSLVCLLVPPCGFKFYVMDWCNNLSHFFLLLKISVSAVGLIKYITN